MRGASLGLILTTLQPQPVEPLSSGKDRMWITTSAVAEDLYQMVSGLASADL